MALARRRLILGFACVVGAAVGAIVVRPIAPTAVAPTTLDYYLVTDDKSVVQKRIHLQRALVEAVVADCMRAIGFSYIPNLEEPSSPDSSLPPREWVAKYGFGATTRLEGPELVVPDPNLEFMNNLAPTERENYRTALFGSPTTSGCRQNAETAVIAPRDKAIQAIQAPLSEFTSEQSDHPVVRRAETRWAECAAAAGLPTARRDAAGIAQQIFNSRLADLKAPDGSYDSANLAALQAEERSLALRLFECDESYRAEVRPVTDQFLASWIDRHKPELIALRRQLIKIDDDLSAMWARLGTPP